MSKKIRKILVANRGEIACRIIRTARRLGIKTVAIYSDPDRRHPNVWLADEAYPLHGVTAQETYLNIDKVLQIAKESEVDAIHPGYGFLSENALFSKEVAETGLQFIGPSPYSIDLMGNKIAAKEAVQKFDVPLVPGIDYAIQDADKGKKVAAEIGYPILIKAAAGGGGKGMRIVHEESQFSESFDRAVGEAQSAFNDGRVFIEKYIESPKHIEVQILADKHGEVIHLFERECSIQRRHQKVIEEAPSPSIDPSTRRLLGETAIKVAKSADYLGAGTVEFIMDQNGDFYFLEMNTRLQVEHPVTEWITGIDLVEQQIRIADGEHLPEQSSISLNGHAIELRVYAEDARNQFHPSPGTITEYQIPSGPNIRIDDGVICGNEISVYYDPMISKLITFGDNREAAIAELKWAIDQYLIQGVETTLDFGKFVLDHPKFLDSSFDTHFVQQYFKPDYLDSNLQPVAKIAAYLFQKELKKVKVSK